MGTLTEKSGFFAWLQPFCACHYCYLQTTLGNKPYIRTYVNMDEILEQAGHYIDERKPEITEIARESPRL
jgi:biotin synthase-like enzyme